MENNDTNLFGNLEQLKAFSQLMGGGQDASLGMDGIDIKKAMETAQQMGTIMNLFQNSAKPEEKEEDEPMDAIGPFSPSRQMNVISAAIPFLDKEYQKNIFIAIRLLEMKRAMTTDVVMMQKQDAPSEEPARRRRRMLSAVRPYLSKEERKNIDFLMKAIEMKKMFQNREEK